MNVTYNAASVYVTLRGVVPTALSHPEARKLAKAILALTGETDPVAAKETPKETTTMINVERCKEKINLIYYCSVLAQISTSEARGLAEAIFGLLEPQKPAEAKETPLWAIHAAQEIICNETLNGVDEISSVITKHMPTWNGVPVWVRDLDVKVMHSLRKRNAELETEKDGLLKDNEYLVEENRKLGLWKVERAENHEISALKLEIKGLYEAKDKLAADNQSMAEKLANVRQAIRF